MATLTVWGFDSVDAATVAWARDRRRPTTHQLTSSTVADAPRPELIHTDLRADQEAALREVFAD